METGATEWLDTDGTIKIEKAFKAYYKQLCAFACAIVKDDAEAEEVVQQVFLKLWEKKESITVKQSVPAYLYSAVHNRSLNCLKHRKVKENYQKYAAYHVNSHANHTADKLQMSELNYKLHEAINGLPEQCRIIFQMSRSEMLKYQEIADRLGISVKTVENQIGKALRILRSKLIEFLPLLLLLFNR